MIRTLIHISLISLFALTPVFADVPPLINYQGKIAVGGVDFNGNGRFKFALVNGGVNLSQTATATATVVNGFVVGATINSGGTGYTSSPTVTVSGVGTGAQLTATVAGGIVTGIQVVNPGSGYQAASTTITLGPPTPNLAITTYWSNDGSSTGGSQPAQPVSLSVSGGGYSVLLGDAQIPNMLPIPIEAFKNDDVRLRVWFSDGANGFQLMTPDQRISAVGYAMIAANVPDGAITSAQLADGAVTGSKIAAGSVSANQLASGAVSSDKIAIGAISSEKLASGAVSMASARDGNILMRKEKDVDLENKGFVMIGLLNNTKIRDSTNITSIDASKHKAIWTGKEVIVWGNDSTNAGFRYNPTTDTTTAINTAGAPHARDRYTSIWTGKEMIIWGGYTNGNSILPTNTGGCYNPTTDTWKATSSVGAPYNTNATTVWTGAEMIVWGVGGANLGYRYNPTTDAWSTINTIGGPSGRRDALSVWTGTEMIVWGGRDSQDNSIYTGGRYNPVTDSWTQTSTTGEIGNSRFGFWTGAEMIVGVRAISTEIYGYNPISNTWIQKSSGLPGGLNGVERVGYSLIWSGKEIILWGGYNSAQLGGIPKKTHNTGFSYNPTTATWHDLTPTLMELSRTNFTLAPYSSEGYKISERTNHTAIWAGTGMILLGGITSSTATAKTEIVIPSASYFYSNP
jgi:hypothetical protein